MLLWTKIKQNNLQICIDHAPSCVHFCKKIRMQEGGGCFAFSSAITINRKGEWLKPGVGDKPTAVVGTGA